MEPQKLPNAHQAIIDPSKIRDYCLNKNHPRGKHKARLFEEILGITDIDTDLLIEEITKQIQTADCLMGEADRYGQRYIVDITLEKNGRKAMVRTVWIIAANQFLPRLATCYVK